MSNCQPDVTKYNNIWGERHQLVLMRGKVEMESHGGRCKGGDMREEGGEFSRSKEGSRGRCGNLAPRFQERPALPV